MKKIAFLLSVMLFSLSGHSQTNTNNLYKRYSLEEKKITEFEWRLVQVNLNLAEDGYFVYFDSSINLFKVDKFVDTYTLETTPPDLQRRLLLSKCNLVSAVIGSRFVEFRQRNKKDLNIKFIIGESSARHFASCTSGKFSFTDAYYDFRRESGK